MSKFTIEQLESLKEGTTPGAWVVKRESPTMQQAYFNIHRQGDHRTRIKGYTNGHNQDPELIAASPALLDQLISTEAKLKQLKEQIECLADWHDTKAMKARDFPHPQEKERFIGKAEAHETARNKLTQILKGNA